MSVIDRRAEIGGLAAWCHENNIGLLAYGVLLGGFISEKWLGRAEPQESELSTGLMKYLRFINAAGEYREEGTRGGKKGREDRLLCLRL